uniref:GH131_N domain-containing protein n=1 Tax=Caenorhabditis tropicalis TaxID=1561998 RepID=A0A1I7TPY1_9PELO
MTLDELLKSFDDEGFSNGWLVNSDLTISTTNSANVTSQLEGELFIATPTMVKDPNFLVSSVRGSRVIKQRNSGTSTIVFLTSYNPNTSGQPAYAGFNHIRIENFTQQEVSEIFIYRNLPDDYYSDSQNPNNTRKLIFSNPLKHNLGANPSVFFFETIDPLQFSETIWFKSVGGFQMTISDTYVDTTNQVAGATTSTGMANSQLLTNTSQVTFVYQGNNRYGSSGYVLSTDMYSFGNITIQLNGPTPWVDTYKATGQQNVDNLLRELNWQALNLQLNPTGLVVGSYYVQYFKIDNGEVTTESPQTSQSIVSTSAASSVPPASSSASPSGTSPSVTPQVSTSTVQTTTSSTSTSTVIISMIATLFSFLYV